MKHLVWMFVLVLCGAVPASGQTPQPSPSPTVIDFEQFDGPSVFTSIQPPLQVGSATFSGGQVLSAASFLPADPTKVYGTAVFCAGCSPTITIDFSTPVSNFSMLVLNGQTFTVTYTALDNNGNSQTVSLPANSSSGAATVMFAQSGITKVTLTGNAAEWDFFVDNVRFFEGQNVKTVEFEQVDGAVDDNPQGSGGGKRIFPDAEAEGGQPQRKIRVRAKLASATPNVDVFLRAFDVDDSGGLFNTGQGNDNLGPQVRQDNVPQQGMFETSNSPQVTVKTDANGVATAIFLTTMQPGDNFRVAAGTKQEVVNRLAVNGRELRDPQSGQTLAEETAAKPGGDEAVASKLLTVWRRMHVEVDSMPDPPAGDADAERNFLRGTVTGIRNSDRLTLLPDATTPALPLDDGSKNLSGSGQNNGKGRYEKGTITLGTGAGAVTITDLEGNGADFVRKNNMVIPIRLVDSEGNNPIPANANQTETVTGLDSAAREFTISQGVRNVNYVGGTLTVAGVNFTVTAAQGRRITVQQDAVLPFRLVDDDQAAAPFLVNAPQGTDAQGGTPFEFMQTSDDPSRNPYARAYILPVYDLGPGAKTRDFNRNLEPGLEVARVSQGQDFTSGRDYWVVYLQGAFQGAVLKDVDPGAEGGVLGDAVAAVGTDGSLSMIGGAAIYRESIRDIELFLNVAVGTCLRTTVPHETGHQFGLRDGTGGLMDQGCPKPNPQFVDDQLKSLRRRPHPQGL